MLTGLDWGLEECWAFHQGFISVRNTGTVSYPDLAEQQAEFDARVHCSSFTRSLINESSETLTPENLAQKRRSLLPNSLSDTLVKMRYPQKLSAVKH
ncbi:aminopeptidase B [Actinobacillus equuli]|nr:aminopeptidase B [Actinobacillus equuli]